MVVLFFLLLCFIFYDKDHSKYVDQIKRVDVRLPNETEYLRMSVDFNLFRLKNEFEDELFGEYKGCSIFIKK
jgi:hypothetical protein